MESYIVRIWPGDTEGGSPDEVRGVARHVRTGRELRFSAFEELLEFLTDAAVDPTRTVAPDPIEGTR